MFNDQLIVSALLLIGVKVTLTTDADTGGPIYIVLAIIKIIELLTCHFDSKYNKSFI